MREELNVSSSLVLYIRQRWFVCPLCLRDHCRAILYFWADLVEVRSIYIKVHVAVRYRQEGNIYTSEYHSLILGMPLSINLYGGTNKQHVYATRAFYPFRKKVYPLHTYKHNQKASIRPNAYNTYTPKANEKKTTKHKQDTNSKRSPTK